MLHTPSHSSPSQSALPHRLSAPPAPTCLPEGRVLLKALRVLRVPLPRPLIKQVEGTYLDLPPLFLSLHSALTTKILTFSGFFPFPFLFLFLFSLSFFLCRSLSLLPSTSSSFEFAVILPRLLPLRNCAAILTLRQPYLSLSISSRECSTAVSRPLRPTAPHHPPLKTTTTPPR